MQRFGLVFEFVLLFVALPLAYRFSPVRIPPIPLLWCAAGYAYWQLARTPDYDLARLWNPASAVSPLPQILLIWGVVATLLWLATRWLAPDLLWSFMKARPVVWAVVMVLYPVLSVYPQSLLYRAFFVERYAAFFPERWTLILASAIAFGFMHLVFRNRLAVGLTFAGGLLFTARYLETGSLFPSALEHALYGCFLFTLGLGQYFYHRSFRMK
jgi:membrane protease YdiL (CAAX protease family)